MMKQGASFSVLVRLVAGWAGMGATPDGEPYMTGDGKLGAGPVPQLSLDLIAAGHSIAEGAVLVDPSAFEEETRARALLDSPTPHPTIAPDAVEVAGHGELVSYLMSGDAAMKATLRRHVQIKCADHSAIGPLDSVGSNVYAEWWRRRGAQVGRWHAAPQSPSGVVVWEGATHA